MRARTQDIITMLYQFPKEIQLTGSRFYDSSHDEGAFRFRDYDFVVNARCMFSVLCRLSQLPYASGTRVCLSKWGNGIKVFSQPQTVDIFFLSAVDYETWLRVHARMDNIVPVWIKTKEVMIYMLKYLEGLEWAANNDTLVTPKSSMMYDPRLTKALSEIAELSIRVL